ncbi:MAG: hypothetical protein JWM98_404 [Thermoleophilia bacterium]|nr:hypothetical protein [Thermoleophilia bacterium]
MDVTTTRAATPAPAPAATARREDYGFSTKRLPALRPLQARVVFREYAPLEASQRFVDLMPDMTSSTFDQLHFTSLADAVRAAHDLSTKDDRSAIGVISSRSDAGDAVSYLLRPLMVVAAGGVHMGDLARPASHWRGDVAQVPRWHDDARSAIGIAPIALAVRDADLGAGPGSVRIEALIVGEGIADRATGRTGWDTKSLRPLPWREFGA